MAYYGDTPINQGAAGLGRHRSGLVSIMAPPLAGLGQDEPEPAPPLVSPAPEDVVVVEMSPLPTLGRLLSLAGFVGGAYHGYKRNQSAGWAFGWAVFGGIVPIFALPLAVAQGFAQPKRD